MICEVRKDNNEVVLSKPTLGDILAVIDIYIHKHKEIVFSRPQVGEGGIDDH